MDTIEKIRQWARDRNIIEGGTVEEAKRELDLTDLASRSPALAELLKQREALG